MKFFGCHSNELPIKEILYQSVFGDKYYMIGHKFTISVTMDVSPFAWCLARAVLKFENNYDNILRKTIEVYSNSFDYITVEKIISIQGIFVSDRTTNMPFSRMQNKIYGSLVTIQYHTKCTNPLYPKFTSKKFSVNVFCCNLYLFITYVLILTTDQSSHPFISDCT